jgi:hypothetical protein
MRSQSSVQPFQWAPPASTSAISDPMATAILVMNFMVFPSEGE